MIKRKAKLPSVVIRTDHGIVLEKRRGFWVFRTANGYVSRWKMNEGSAYRAALNYLGLGVSK